MQACASPPSQMYKGEETYLCCFPPPSFCRTPPTSIYLPLCLIDWTTIHSASNSLEEAFGANGVKVSWGGGGVLGHVEKVTALHGCITGRLAALSECTRD